MTVSEFVDMMSFFDPNAEVRFTKYHNSDKRYANGDETLDILTVATHCIDSSPFVSLVFINKELADNLREEAK